MALDTTSVRDELNPDERGPSQKAAPVIAKEHRLYEIAERSVVLVREGERVPRRLVGLSYRPAELVDGVFAPKTGTKARK